MKALFMVMCESTDKETVSPSFASSSDAEVLAEIFDMVCQAEQRKKYLESTSDKDWTYKIMQLIPIE